MAATESSCLNIMNHICKSFLDYHYPQDVQGPKVFAVKFRVPHPTVLDCWPVKIILVAMHVVYVFAIIVITVPT
eukprot:2436389-Amphidinium_carterae.1